MELQKTCLEAFQIVSDQIIVQEETLESIVPDACPDILRIVEAAGEASLKTKELTEGSLRLGGSIRASVLYIPEGEPGPRKVEVRIPYVCGVEDPSFHPGGRVVAAPRLCGVDAQTVNPRKVLVRAQLAVSVTVMDPQRLEVSTGASGEEAGLQQRLEERTTYRVAAVQEKPFQFSDTLNLPASMPPAEELLRSQVEARCLDAKIIGAKLIVKGEAVLRALCRCAGGELETARFELPFSQILEIPGAQEGADVTVETALCASECTLQPGEPGTLAVSLELLAQAVVREVQSVEVLSDLYCTQCPVETDREELVLSRLLDAGVQRQQVRQLCESGLPVKSVVECSLSIGRLTRTEGENGVGAAAGVLVSVLFYSEDDALCAAAYPIQAEAALGTQRDAVVRCGCRSAGNLAATPVTGGMEVRFDLEFPYLVLGQETCPMVTGVRPLPAEEGGGPKPSVILRVVGEKEPLWDIAKACSSTVADIMTANELDSDSAPAGKLLLIPKQR